MVPEGRPPVLDYADGSDLNERRGARLMGWYWIGMTAAAVAMMAIVFNAQPGYVALSARLQTCGMTIAFAALWHFLPATFAASLGVWIRQKREGILHYRSAVSPLLWGFLGFVVSALVLWPLVELGWSMVFSFIAGTCLVGRAARHDQPRLFLVKRFRRYWMVTGTVTAVLLGGGYLSAWLSRGAVEQALAIKVVNVNRGRPFKLLPDSRWDGARIFRAGGIVTLGPATPPDYFPWGDVGDVHLEGPFQVSGKWSWCLGPQYGGGSKIVYFCFFGLVIEMDEPETWAS
jgi:hypothetical protein